MSTLRVDNLKGRTSTTLNVPSGETFAVAGNQTVGGNVTVTGTLTVSGGGSFSTTGAVTVGDLTVNGTTTTINSTTLSVDDKNIELGSVASPSDATANGGGITLKGASDKTFLWDNVSLNWTPTPGFHIQHTSEALKGLTTTAATTINYNYNSDVENCFFVAANDTGNLTLNITNLPTTEGKVYTWTFFINPASTKTCQPSGVTIDGTAQTLRWSGGAAPTPSTDGKEDIYTVSVVRRDSNSGGAAWLVFVNGSVGYG